MKKLFKTLLLLTLVFFVIPATPLLASPTWSTETEPNNSMSEANSVARNLSTPKQAVDGSFTGENVMKGSGTKGEDDWYRIYLSSDNDSYLSFILNSGVYDITVYDENGNIVGRNDYKSVSRKTIYDLKIQTDGTYYIQIACIVSGSYQFMIGNPNYTTGTYSLSLGSLALVKGSDYETYKDNTLITAVPKGALVYRILLRGGSSSSTESRQVKPSATKNWINSSAYVWEANLVIKDTNKFHQKWDFKYIAKKTITIPASAYFYYVYPVLPTDDTE